MVQKCAFEVWAPARAFARHMSPPLSSPWWSSRAFEGAHARVMRRCARVAVARRVARVGCDGAAAIRAPRARIGAVVCGRALSSSSRASDAPGAVAEVWLYDPRGFLAAHGGAGDVDDACARLTTDEERATMRATPERLLARAFARRVLASASAGDGDDARTEAINIAFDIGARGKPRLKAWDATVGGVRGFSVSHCDGLVAVATTRDASAEIGCDVESEIRRLGSDIGKFSARWMSSGERQGLDAITDDEEKARAFMKLWTLKEAYVKALGLGIAGRPFREFDVAWERVEQREDARCTIDGVRNASEKGGIWRIDLRDDAAPAASRAWSMALLKPRLEHEHVLALCMPSAGESTRADIRVRWATPFDDIVNEGVAPALLGASSRFFV